jgi:hypothetical protein
MSFHPTHGVAGLKGLAVALLVGVTALSAAPATASTNHTESERGHRSPSCERDHRPSRDASYLCAQSGDLVDVRIGDVHATQPSLGYDEVYYKLGRYTLGKDAINKKFDDWCEANGQVQAATVSVAARLDDPTSFACALPIGAETPASIALMKTVVIGPHGDLYLTDGHHTLTSFFETADGGPDLHVRLRVLGNLSQLKSKDFWAQMEANKWVWLRDVDGLPVKATDLPTGVGLAKFENDKYRSLLYFARDIGYAPGSIPFQEFSWGTWLRASQPVDLTGWNQDDAASYLDAVKKVSTAQTALPGATVIDSGWTATELGALTLWNDGAAETAGEFAKLSKPYTDAKPGKIAYALAYKLTLAS